MSTSAATYYADVVQALAEPVEPSERMKRILSALAGVRADLYDELQYRETRGDEGAVYAILADLHEDTEALLGVEA